MRQTEIEEFQQLITDVLAFYGKDVSEFAISVWWQACKDFEMEQIRKAMTRHATDAEHGQFAPKPADIVRQLSGTKTDKSMIAWGKVNEAMGRIGAYSDVVFDDPAIHAAVSDCGGWVKMCRSNNDDLSYLQHRFCQSYQAYAGREDFDFPHLLGGDRSPDEFYTKRGLKPPIPVMIGDTVKANGIYAGSSLLNGIVKMLGR
jgi:hypothetical protein